MLSLLAACKMSPRVAESPPAITCAPGARAMRAPTLAQTPVAVWSTDPNVGCTGQQNQRPKMTKRAGNKVSMTISPAAIPTAATGPRPWVEFMVATSRHSMPAMTVEPLAKIAGPTRCNANAIAS